MKLLVATQDALFESLDYHSGNLIAKASIVPVLKVCGQTYKALRVVGELLQHFDYFEERNRVSSARSLELIFDENPEEEFNQLIRVQGPLLGELGQFFNKDLQIQVKIEELRWIVSSSCRPRPRKSTGVPAPLWPNLPQCASNKRNDHEDKDDAETSVYDDISVDDDDDNDESDGDNNDDSDGEAEVIEESSGWKSNVMRFIREPSGSSGLKKYFCQGRMSSKIPDKWSTQFYEAEQWTGISVCMKIRLIISIAKNNLDEPVPDLELPKALSINQKILKEEHAADVILVAQCGTKVKCHKNFLSAHSGEFAAMFKEAGSRNPRRKTATVEMGDMTKESIEAFLEYIYCCELGQAKKSPRIALELLEAARKYNVQALEKATKTIFMSMPSNWYDVPVALKLFTLARDAKDCGYLKSKSVQVLKSMSKELVASAEYDDLFAKNLEGAKELCALAFLG